MALLLFEIPHPGRSRVPTSISFSNSLRFPCFFPVRPQIFPVPIYVFFLANTEKFKKILGVQGSKEMARPTKGAPILNKGAI